jgi:UDP-N-acetylmuramoylalanine--D-glutamate ligase
VSWARERGTPIWGDIELAWRVRDKIGPVAAEWILITGTNGKTTTTQLTASMLLTDGRRVAPCGNIGVPVLDAVRDPAGFDVLVVELSSFQLHWMPLSGPGSLNPLASACLNLAEDHYDWHGSAEAYAAAKGKVYANTTIACVYNLGDDSTVRMVERADVAEGCRAIGFGASVPTPSNVGVVDEFIVDRAFLDDRHRSALELASLDDVMAAGLATPHGLANVLAAAALARAAGVQPRSVRDALRSFTVDAHRTELVLHDAEISWVDDSKATNPHAAASALSAYRSVVWIVGGLLKGVDVAPLVQEHRGRLRAAIIIGTERSAVRSAFERHAPELPVFEVQQQQTEGVMIAAVRLAAEVAQPGDTVLLAPAAASMDQFVDYADRGDRFAAAVRQHVKGESDDDGPASAPGQHA